MIRIENLDKWEKNRKSWWDLYGIHQGSKSYIAKINSKGLTWIAAQEFNKIYEEVIIS
jgi:hypothetical protein